MKRTKVLAVLGAAVLCGVGALAEAGSTLEAVKKKGYLQCGVGDDLPGFSQADENGRFRGFDVDMCRAVAAAIFGDAERVRYSPLNARDRFTALQARDVDLLARNSTWTSSRDAAMGLNFVGITYYDGQGFLVSRKLGAGGIKALDNAAICVQAGTTTELRLADHFRDNGLKYTPISYDSPDESVRALASGRCQALTSDRSQLYAQRLKLAAPDDYVVLPEAISKEPLALAVRQGDEEWFDIVRWSLFALIDAEELGVASRDVEALARTPPNPEVARLLGSEGDFGKDLRLPKDWVVRMVAQVGNYGEIFERNLGAGSPLKIERGLNALWTRGGLHYAPPVR